MKKILGLLMIFMLMASCAQLKEKLRHFKGEPDPKTPYKVGSMITVTLEDGPAYLIPKIFKTNGIIEERAIVNKKIAGKTYSGVNTSNFAWIKRNGVKGNLYFKIKGAKVPSKWVKAKNVFSKMSFIGKVTKVAGECASGDSNGDFCRGHNQAYVDEITFIRWSKKNMDEFASIAKNKAIARANARKAKTKRIAEFKARRAKNPKQTKICDNSYKALIKLRGELAASNEGSLEKRKKRIMENKNIIRSTSRCAFTLNLYKSDQKDDVRYFDKCMEYYLIGTGQEMWCK